MTWTLVQKTASVATGASGTVTGTLPAGSTAGNLLVAFLGAGTGGSQFTGPAGWTQGPQIGNGSVSRSEIWYYLNNPGSISSAVFTCGTTGVRCELAEFHTDVANAVVSLDFSGTGTAGAVASCTATATATAGDLAVCAFTEKFNTSQSGITWTDPAGFTLAASMANGNSLLYSAYQLSASAGSLSVTGTSSAASANANAWTGAVATFKAAAAGAQTVLVGATVPLPGFPGLNDEQAQAAFAAATGRPQQVHRVYFTPGQFPITPGGKRTCPSMTSRGASPPAANAWSRSSRRRTRRHRRTSITWSPSCPPTRPPG